VDRYIRYSIRSIARNQPKTEVTHTISTEFTVFHVTIDIPAILTDPIMRYPARMDLIELTFFDCVMFRCKEIGFYFGHNESSIK